MISVTQESLPRPDGAPEGQVLLGKYRVERILGVGGMGTVVAAHHLQLDTPVAIKFLRPSFLTNQDAVACFMREARAMANGDLTQSIETAYKGDFDTLKGAINISGAGNKIALNSVGNTTELVVLVTPSISPIWSSSASSLAVVSARRMAM